jgi:hypothetical protein
MKCKYNHEYENKGIHEKDNEGAFQLGVSLHVYKHVCKICGDTKYRMDKAI